MAKIARIRTSDRILFKRCRRAWAFKSHLKRNLEPKVRPEPLWTGTGVHFALEDFHGERFYETPANAFRAFTIACRKTPKYNLPDDWRNELKLAVGMLDYYSLWLSNRDSLTTYIHEGVPQLEVNFELDLTSFVHDNPWGIEPADHIKEYDKILYCGTLDRVVVDEFERLWIVEYKTAKQFLIHHLETDPQVTTYTWSAESFYGKPVEGTIYQQHKKKIPEEPRLLSNGTYSTSKSQSTTHAMYRRALINLYGSVAKAPADNIACLNHFAETETRDSDAFIRRDFVRRNNHQVAAEGQKILMEIEDILNPNLPLYPNPTRDCSWCDLASPCVSLDDGSDWEAELADTTQSRNEVNTQWQKHLPQLQEVLELQDLQNQSKEQ